MNQRMLVIIAVLLLGAGGFGLLQSDEKAVDSVTVNSYTAAKALPKGELLTADSYSKTVRQMPPEEAKALENMPESLEGYETLKDIAAGEALDAASVQLAPKDRITLKDDYFIWPITMRAEEAVPLKRLKKGDRVDLYLRYFIEIKSREGKRVEFVNRSGKKIVTPIAKMVKLVGSRRFFSLAKAEASLLAKSESAASMAENKSPMVMVEIELANEDINRIYATAHLGETVILPAGVSPGGNIQTIIPEMITEIRGGVRK